MNECDAVEVVTMINDPKTTLEPLLKKRVNQWSHEVRKVLTIYPERVIPLNYGDRFIPRRYSIAEKDSNEALLFKGGKEDFLSSLSPIYWRHKGLKMIMNSSFGIKQRRILEFADLAAKSAILSSEDVLPAIPIYEFIYGSLNGFDWPCMPRSRPMACADTTHDLPYFDMFSNFNLIDWSVDGQIAASFGQDLVLWKPSLDLTLVYKIPNIKSIAYCPKGHYLAIGSLHHGYPIIELWNVQNYKELCIDIGHAFENMKSTVLCIEWARSGKVLICGTATGWVYVFDAVLLDPIRILKNHRQSVFMIKFSPTMRYLATSDVEGNVYVYNWPSCSIHVVLRSKRKLRVVIDWHPWNGTDLAISEDSPASIVILHVPSREIVAYYQRKDRRAEIDFITFNKVTGELLVSYSNKDSDGCIHSEILVMSSLDRVVDVLRVPDSCVRFMMWSPTAMQLATAGNDETLTIWNFLPKRGKDGLARSVDNIHKHQPKMKQTKCTFDNMSYGKEFTKLITMK